MIYCVEDDSSIRELMLYTLRASDFQAKGFTGAEPLFAALHRELPDLILLDIMLPGMDGIEILKKLRLTPAFRDIPVIMATAKGTEYDKVLALDLGADDYLAKPFGMMEMVSRIRAVLRRTQKGAQVQKMSLWDLTLDPAAHRVLVSGKTVELTLKEFELLRLFLEQPGKALSRELLLTEVWGTDYFGETRTVDVHIGTLRTKLGASGEHIKTVRGVGYRMESEA